MTPKQVQNELAQYICADLQDEGFAAKRKGIVWRKQEDCEQYAVPMVTSDRGAAGSFTIHVNLIFRYAEADKLVCRLLDRPYDARWATGSSPLYLQKGKGASSYYKYHAQEDLGLLGAQIAGEIRAYGIAFWSAVNTLDKLAQCIAQGGENTPRFSLLHRKDTHLYLAAIYYLQGQGAKLEELAQKADTLPFAQAEKIEALLQQMAER